MKNERPDLKIPVSANGSLRPKERRIGSLASSRATLITGGAGFIGTNVAHRLLEQGQRVLIYDNLSRPGVERNLHWLQREHGERLQVEVADIRDGLRLRRSLRRAVRVFHFAAQVAVTTSLVDPVLDFETNARGTLNLLEEIRALSPAGHGPPVLFTSTNKVYGALAHIPLRTAPGRHEPVEAKVHLRGIDESHPLDFHSPYGCSKGVADQLVLDYARSFGLRTIVFRMSCIYGPHQCGTEDQGWVAHFVIRALQKRPITLYGDGLQVRDLLFADDLVDAMLLAQERIDDLSGEAFNIGGGPGNAVSLIELMKILKAIHGEHPHVNAAPWRIGDQRYFTADTRKFSHATGWKQRIGVREGVERLYHWLRGHHVEVRTRALVLQPGHAAALAATSNYQTAAG